MIRLLLILLLAGSVQGRDIYFTDLDTTTCSITGNVTLAKIPGGWSREDARVSDVEYWCADWIPCFHAVIGPCCEHYDLYRRLDRWYKKPALDTTFVGLPSDDLTPEGDVSYSIAFAAPWVQVFLDNATLNERWVVRTRLSIDSLWAKRIKKTKTEWVIPND